MVNLGPSRGCQTCKRRRVKCDEAKPSCNRCLDGGIDCAGYEKARSREIRFKDQTKTVEQRSQRKSTTAQFYFQQARKQSLPAQLPSVPEDEERGALCFFLNNFAAAGRDFNSTRGFFECIAPSLAAASADSIVVLSVSAVATTLYNKWRGTANNELHLKRFGQALRKLRDALQDPNQSRTTETLLATLLLQFHENLLAVTGLKKARRAHQNGAMALVRHQGLQNFRTDIAKHLLLYIRHVEVSSAIRENRSVPDDLTTWCEVVNMPRNPSTELDQLGVLVANTQHDFEQLVLHQAHCTNSCCIHAQSLVEVTNQALAVENHLIAWSDTVPDWWHPVKLASIREVQPPVVAYSGICEIYPSIQIASIWNSYRSYRLIILRILLTVTKISSEHTLGDLDSQQIHSRLQALLDSIVYCVPFYLGNRTRPSTTVDMTDGSIEMPGYHSISSEGKPWASENGVLMSRDEHTRHATAQ